MTDPALFPVLRTFPDPSPYPDSGPGPVGERRGFGLFPDRDFYMMVSYCKLNVFRTRVRNQEIPVINNKKASLNSLDLGGLSLPAIFVSPKILFLDV